MSISANTTFRNPQNIHDESRYLQVECDLHPGEVFYHFCESTTCYKPLCPECVTEHLKEHKLRNEIPEIISMNAARERSSRKLKGVQITLSKELERLESEFMVNPQEAFSDGMEKLDAAKDKLKSLIDSYFDQLSEELRRVVTEHHMKSNYFTGVIKTITEDIMHLKQIDDGLYDSNAYINSVKKAFLLNGYGAVESIRDQIKDIAEKKNLSFLNIVVDESELSGFQANLLKYSFIDIEYPYSKTFKKNDKKSDKKGKKRSTSGPKTAKKNQ
eukprot:TRINITY_DN3166_c0_g1_i1.p2 TRINITY_DN3166_c0_g1~~TRINITY_DN3166_c0_g1_i1.p2  ORF type:complete len:272 (-),score=24.44 TRINITY_DN3166_c0_g1_i1:119-934(-)